MVVAAVLGLYTAVALVAMVAMLAAGGLGGAGPCGRGIRQNHAMWPSCPHEWQFTLPLGRVDPDFFGTTRGALLA